MNMVTLAPKFPELVKETRPGCNGSPEYRIVDSLRKIRTPWLAPGYTNENAACCAVLRTDRTRLKSQHTVDGEWIVVRGY